MQHNISVVIVTYNGLKWIEKCLKSIEASIIPLNSIVIDNNSTDGTVAFIEERYPKITLIKNQLNLGFGKANNMGLKIAYEQNASHILLLNQDAWIYNDTVVQLINALEQNPSYFITVPIILQASEKALEIHFEKLIASRYCKGFISDHIVEPNNLKNIYEVKFMHAAIWLLSKECIETIGGFDPLFPHNSEDNDYINRVHYFHKKIGVCPYAKVVHDTNTKMGSYDSYPRKKRRLLYYVTNIAHQKNINHSFVHGFSFVLWYNFKAILLNLTKFRLLCIVDRILSWFKFVLNVYEIINHRKTCKHEGLTFLN